MGEIQLDDKNKKEKLDNMHEKVNSNITAAYGFVACPSRSLSFNVSSIVSMSPSWLCLPRPSNAAFHYHCLPTTKLSIGTKPLLGSLGLSSVFAMRQLFSRATQDHPPYETRAHFKHVSIYRCTRRKEGIHPGTTCARTNHQQHRHQNQPTRRTNNLVVVCVCVCDPQLSQP